MLVAPTAESMFTALNAISGIKGCQFGSILYRSKSINEIARYTVLLGFSYHNLMEKSLVEIKAILPTLKTPLEIEAGNAILESINKTLTAHAAGQQNPDYTKLGMYTHLGNGININNNDGTWQVFGLLQSKTVISPGDPRKPVNSKPLTIAKNKIDKALSKSRFREFAFDYTNVGSVKVDGQTLVIE